MKLSTLTSLHLLLVFLRPVSSDFRFKTCGSNTSTYAPNSTYHSSLTTVLSILKSASSSSYFNSSSMETPQKVQGLYQCRLDVSPEVCSACVGNASESALRNCPNLTSAIVWYDECFLRYSDDTIVSKLDTSTHGYLLSSVDVAEDEQPLYAQFVRNLFKDSANEVIDGGMKNFVAEAENTYLNFSQTNNIYSVIQCTEDLSLADCSQCVLAAIMGLSRCCSQKLGGRVLLSSCYIRFEANAFYNISAITISHSPPPTPPAPPPGGSGVSVAAIVVPVVAIVLLLFVGWYLCAGRRSRETRGSHEIPTAESLKFTLSTIAAATGNFSPSNKLGHGGFGDVFKGVLADGVEIAVKRLSKDSNQGATEFKNEVVLVAQLQHRNLARLLGFCAEGKEKILVYEFVPNKSLDYILFDPKKRERLTWPRRRKIIDGVARGLLYLHEDSRLKIIHRDLKPSNILLDDDMTPKISDFGMARIFGADQTRSNTMKIAGTRGYMSPEYAMHGRYSVKSDVYSFGVQVLEIVTGRKCLSSDDNGDDLLTYVWEHWRDERVLAVVDPSLGDGYTGSEVVRCIHISLLCVQEDPGERPSMASVVLMLNSSSVTIAPPRIPAFFYSRGFRSVDWSELDSTRDKSSEVSRSIRR